MRLQVESRIADKFETMILCMPVFVTMIIMKMRLHTRGRCARIPRFMSITMLESSKGTDFNKGCSDMKIKLMLFLKNKIV